jgi:hypothetical protein
VFVPTFFLFFFFFFSRKTAFWLVSRLRELGVEAYEEEFEISNSSSFTPSSTMYSIASNKTQRKNLIRFFPETFFFLKEKNINLMSFILEVVVVGM